MVRGKTKYKLLVAGRRNRICFKEAPIIINYSQGGQTAYVYPNYGFQNGQLTKSRTKPKKFKLTVNIIEDEEEEEKKAPSQPKYKEITIQQIEYGMTNNQRTKMQANCRSTFQVHFLEYYPVKIDALTQDDKAVEEAKRSEVEREVEGFEGGLEDHLQIDYQEEETEGAECFEPTTGTGVFVKYEDNFLVLSALHVFQPRGSGTKREIILTTSYDDCSEIVAKLFEEFLDSSSKTLTFHEYLKKREETNKKDTFEWCSADLDTDFLQFRKNWLQQISSKDKWKILDSKSRLKPSPAFDMAILNLPKESVDKLLAGNREPVVIDPNACQEIQANALVYLVGYNKAIGKVNFGDNEYQQTVVMSGENETFKRKRAVTAETSLINFVNRGKSLSRGECLSSQEPFIHYKATSTEGSSGGPVFRDDDERLIGIAFGNLMDKELEEERAPVGLENADEWFDIHVAEELKEGSRNYNLAIAINHPGFLDYLNRKFKRNFANFECMANLNESPGQLIAKEIAELGIKSPQELQQDLETQKLLSNTVLNMTVPVNVSPTLEDFLRASGSGNRNQEPAWTSEGFFGKAGKENITSVQGTESLTQNMSLQGLLIPVDQNNLDENAPENPRDHPSRVRDRKQVGSESSDINSKRVGDQETYGNLEGEFQNLPNSESADENDQGKQCRGRKKLKQ